MHIFKLAETCCCLFVYVRALRPERSPRVTGAKLSVVPIAQLDTLTRPPPCQSLQSPPVAATPAAAFDIGVRGRPVPMRTMPTLAVGVLCRGIGRLTTAGALRCVRAARGEAAPPISSPDPPKARCLSTSPRVGWIGGVSMAVATFGKNTGGSGHTAFWSCSLATVACRNGPKS
jgi:hypothetical protein